MATVTVLATTTSAEGHKVLFCTVVGTDNYNRVTGDYIRAGTEVNAVNAVISVSPSLNNGGYPAAWVNASNALFYFGTQNIAASGGNNGQPLLGVGNTVNFATITTPAIIIGRAQ